MAALGPWPADRSVAIAVSGGADSLALALLVSRWASGHAPPLALIVDHGLRAGSADEAGRAAERARSLGCRVRILTPHDLAPGPALQERARARRVALLASACREAGLVDLLLGHHAADQAETIAMRIARGTGPIGLAGMSSISERDGCRLVRPLLRVGPQALRATLRAAGIGWDEDPSNADPRFLRARMRRDGLARPVSGDPCHGDGRRQVERAVEDWAVSNLTVHEAGYATFPDAPIPPDALSALLRTLSGADHPPPRAAVARLSARPRPATLHGVRIARARGGRLMALREFDAIAPAVRVGAPSWDGRYRVVRTRAVEDLDARGWTLGPVGRAPGLRLPAGLPAMVVETLPSLRDGTGRMRRVPHLGWRDGVEAGGEIDVIFAPTNPLGSDFFIV